MTDQLIIALIIRLAIGFIAATLSLLIWSKTRDGAWLTMALGVVFLFFNTLLEILELFGFVAFNSIVYGGIAIIPFAFNILPFMLFATGIVIFLQRVKGFK